jgi:membrane protein YdbS with pleckstrin-like domain
MRQELRPSSRLLGKKLLILWIIATLIILIYLVAGIDWFTVGLAWFGFDLFLMIPFIFALGAFVFFLILSLIIRRNFKYQLYILGEDAISVHRRGLCSKLERVVPYQRITDIMLSSGFLENAIMTLGG